MDFLERIEKVGRFGFDNSLSGALGLDPAVYCYGSEKFYTAAFLAALKFAMELKEQDRLFEFTEARERFEEFLVNHKTFIKDISHGKGSRTRPLESLMELHRTVLKCVLEGLRTDEEIIARLLENPSLKTTIKIPGVAVEQPDIPTKRKAFSKTVQQAKVLQTTLDKRERCPECKARLAPFSRSKDHIVPKEEGGMGTQDNLQFTHPYCNTGYKEEKRARAKKEAAKTVDGSSAPSI